MAKVTPGALISDARGALGTQVFTRNRYGLIVRARVTPANPSSSRQVTSRAIFTRLNGFWQSSLTDSDRAQWNEWGRNHPQTTTLGNTKTLPGFNAFIRASYWRNRINSSAFQKTPYAYTPALRLSSYTAAGVAGTSLYITWTPITPGPPNIIVTQTTGHLSPGRTAPDGTWAIIDAQYISVTQPRNVYSEFTSRWGTPTAGEKTWIRAWLTASQGLPATPKQTFMFTWT